MDDYERHVYEVTPSSGRPARIVLIVVPESTNQKEVGRTVANVLQGSTSLWQGVQCVSIAVKESTAALAWMSVFHVKEASSTTRPRKCSANYVPVARTASCSFARQYAVIAQAVNIATKYRICAQRAQQGGWGEIRTEMTPRIAERVRAGNIRTTLAKHFAAIALQVCSAGVAPQAALAVVSVPQGNGANEQAKYA